jgi:hypothetical protein
LVGWFWCKNLLPIIGLICGNRPYQKYNEIHVWCAHYLHFKVNLMPKSSEYSKTSKIS